MNKTIQNVKKEEEKTLNGTKKKRNYNHFEKYLHRIQKNGRNQIKKEGGEGDPKSFIIQIRLKKW